MSWDSITEFGTTSGYSLVASGHCGKDETTYENAAKSFIADFCRVGPICLQIYNDSTISTRRRLANFAIVKAYTELHCLESLEDVYNKLLLGKSRQQIDHIQQEVFKLAYGNNDGDQEFDDDPRYKFDAAKLRKAIAKIIVVNKT